MATLQELETALTNADKAGDSQAAEILANEIKGRRFLESTALPKGMYEHSSIDPEAPSPLARFGRGLMDIGQGTKQRFLQLTNPEAAAKYTRDVTAEEQRYGKGAGPGFDLFRTLGQAGGAAPVTAALAAASPVTGLGGLALAGLEQGLYQGFLNFTPEGRSAAPQILAGGASGAVAPFAANVGGKVVANVAEAARKGAQRLTTSADDIVEAIKPALDQRGVKWEDLGSGVKMALMNQARRQLAVDGDLSPDALARKLEMQDVFGPGAGPTMGQVTRNPAQFTFERNNQKLGEIGEPLTQRFQAQIQRLQDNVRQLIAGTGAKSQSDYQAGVSATTAINQKLSDSRKVVDDLYSAWRDSGAGATEVKPQALADSLGKVIDEYGAENIPPAVRSRLESFGLLGGKQTKLLTIDEAEKLRRLIGNNDPRNGPASGALGVIRSALDKSVLDTDAPEIPMLQSARRAAAERFAMRDGAAGVTAAAEGDAPDKFFRKYVLNGNIDDLRGLKATLNSTVEGKPIPAGFDYEPAGAQAWKDLKGQTLEYVMSKATAQGEGTFSGKAFRKALNEVGEERLNVLFTPDEIAQLRKLDRVAYGATVEPPFSSVNHSNSAPAAAQYIRQASGAIPSLVEKATGIPLIGKIGAGLYAAGNQVSREAELRKLVSQALNGDAFNPETAVLRRQALARLIADRAAPIGTLGGTASAIEADR